MRKKRRGKKILIIIFIIKFIKKAINKLNKIFKYNDTKTIIWKLKTEEIIKRQNSLEKLIYKFKNVNNMYTSVFNFEELYIIYVQ